jgi:NitT/TauT family transport system permease protein
VLKSFAPLAAIAFVLLVWQGAVALQLAPVWVLPSPAMVWTALVDQANQGILFESAFNSLRKGVQGFAISLIIATPIGIALGLNSALRAIARPLLTGLQQLPSVAWVPAAIIWFGLSDATIFAVVLLGAVPSIANGLISGIDQIPPLYMRAGKVLGARGWSSIRHIVIPAAWPGYLAGLEQGWAFAWRSLMAAELIAISPALGPGLGQMLDTGRQLGDMSLVLGSIIVIMIVGVLIERLVFSPIRQRTLRNRGLVVSR